MQQRTPPVSFKSYCLSVSSGGISGGSTSRCLGGCNQFLEWSAWWNMWLACTACGPHAPSEKRCVPCNSVCDQVKKRGEDPMWICPDCKDEDPAPEPNIRKSGRLQARELHNLFHAVTTSPCPPPLHPVVALLQPLPPLFASPVRTPLPPLRPAVRSPALPPPITCVPVVPTTATPSPLLQPVVPRPIFAVPPPIFNRCSSSDDDLEPSPLPNSHLD